MEKGKKEKGREEEREMREERKGGEKRRSLGIN